MKPCQWRPVVIFWLFKPSFIIALFCIFCMPEDTGLSSCKLVTCAHKTDLSPLSALLFCCALPCFLLQAFLIKHSKEKNDKSDDRYIKMYYFVYQYWLKESLNITYANIQNNLVTGAWLLERYFPVLFVEFSSISENQQMFLGNHSSTLADWNIWYITVGCHHWQPRTGFEHMSHWSEIVGKYRLKFNKWH